MEVQLVYINSIKSLPSKKGELGSLACYKSTKVLSEDVTIEYNGKVFKKGDKLEIGKWSNNPDYRPDTRDAIFDTDTQKVEQVDLTGTEYEGACRRLARLED